MKRRETSDITYPMDEIKKTSETINRALVPIIDQLCLIKFKKNFDCNSEVVYNELNTLETYYMELINQILGYEKK